MAAIALQSIVGPSTTPSYQAATASDTISGAPTDERLFLHAKNTNAATATVTINPVQTSARVAGVGVVTLSAIAVTIPATTGDRMIPIPPAYIGLDGTVTVLNTGTITNLTLAAFRLPPIS